MVLLQDLLNHTAQRLILHLGLESATITPLVLMVKYGFDGTNGTKWKQKWNNTTGNDEHIFCSSLVPLELLNPATGCVLWTNPRPSSTRLCRPIKIEFVRETSEICKQEEESLGEQIAALHPVTTMNWEINFKLALTMIDGKVSITISPAVNSRLHYDVGEIVNWAYKAPKKLITTNRPPNFFFVICAKIV